MLTTPVHSDADLSRVPQTGSIRSVAVLTTGSVDVHPQHAFGSRLPLFVWLIASRRWLPPRPINVYVIDHVDGIVLFDTGMDPGSITDPTFFPSGIVGWLYRRLARFHPGA